MEFDLAKYKKLRKLYNEAVEKKIEMFPFEGRVILVSYAKYMLEYLKDHFGE